MSFGIQMQWHYVIESLVIRLKTVEGGKKPADSDATADFSTDPCSRTFDIFGYNCLFNLV